MKYEFDRENETWFLHNRLESQIQSGERNILYW